MDSALPGEAMDSALLADVAGGVDQVWLRPVAPVGMKRCAARSSIAISVLASISVMLVLMSMVFARQPQIAPKVVPLLPIEFALHGDLTKKLDAADSSQSQEEQSSATDEKAGELTGKVVDNYVSLVKFAKDPSVSSGAGALSSIGATALSVPAPPASIVVGGIFSLVGGILGLFGGDTGPSNADLLDALQKGFEAVNHRLDRIDEKLDRIDEKLAVLASAIDQLNAAVVRLGHTLEAIESLVKDIHTAVVLKANRMTAIQATFRAALDFLRIGLDEHNFDVFFEYVKAKKMDYVQEVYDTFSHENIRRFLAAARNGGDLGVSDFAAALAYQSILARRFELYWILVMGSIYYDGKLRYNEESLLFTQEMSSQLEKYQEIVQDFDIADLVRMKDSDLRTCEAHRAALRATGKPAEHPIPQQTLVWSDRIIFGVLGLLDGCGNSGSKIAQQTIDLIEAAAGASFQLHHALRKLGLETQDSQLLSLKKMRDDKKGALTPFNLKHIGGRCVQPDQGSTAASNNTRLVLYKGCNMSRTALLYNRIYSADGYFLLQHASGKCVQPYPGSNDPADNTKLVLSEDCDTSRQALKFETVPTGDGYFFLKHRSGKCVHPETGGYSRDVQTKLVLREGCDKSRHGLLLTMMYANVDLDPRFSQVLNTVGWVRLESLQVPGYFLCAKELNVDQGLYLCPRHRLVDGLHTIFYMTFNHIEGSFHLSIYEYIDAGDGRSAVGTDAHLGVKSGFPWLSLQKNRYQTRFYFYAKDSGVGMATYGNDRNEFDTEPFRNGQDDVKFVAFPNDEWGPGILQSSDSPTNRWTTILPY
ncbi:unnamed protein product [Symbiodinium natans]|uniref:Uncharacterized protein n=1 Tax=Symbiodinium natans TaxID=878477 RepID=A0A812NUI2_9DINO|nr:unnamed protein product [Symbiodinium natans]